MTNLKAELDQLEDKRLDYVLARSRVDSDSKGYKTAHISKATFYSWTPEEREKLNEIAQKIKRETATRAILVLQDAAEKAALVKVEGLDDRDHRVKQAAATEILDRTVGKSQEKLDVTSGGEKVEQVKIIEIVKSNDESI